MVKIMQNIRHVTFVYCDIMANNKATAILVLNKTRNCIDVKNRKQNHSINIYQNYLVFFFVYQLF